MTARAARSRALTTGERSALATRLSTAIVTPALRWARVELDNAAQKRKNAPRQEHAEGRG